MFLAGGALAAAVRVVGGDDPLDEFVADDVLAFPVDELGRSAGPRELGDVAICPPRCTDVTEAVVHGVLHLCGYDHETDDGEMLALQGEILRSIGREAA